MTDDDLKIIGKEMRAAREAAGFSQEQIALLIEKSGRSWTHQLETGVGNVSLIDYLELVDYLRDTMPPDHPALALVTHIKRRRPRAA